jgi:hypothetical protein
MMMIYAKDNIEVSDLRPYSGFEPLYIASESPNSNIHQSASYYVRANHHPHVMYPSNGPLVGGSQCSRGRSGPVLSRAKRIELKIFFSDTFLEWRRDLPHKTIQGTNDVPRFRCRLIASYRHQAEEALEVLI